MAIIAVSTSGQLQEALVKARAGDVIQLAAGDYSNLVLKGINPSGLVTITSANPQQPADLHDLLVRQSHNLQFSNLAFTTDQNVASPSFVVDRSANITLDGISVSGPALGANSLTTGLQIRNSQSVTVSNSTFHDLRFGVTLLDNFDVSVVRSQFSSIRTDGIRGGGDSKVQVADNTFTNFHPASGDHADAIQLWTTNTSKSASDIVITGNVVDRGNGEPIQGIFVRDELGNLPFKNIVVASNMINGGLYNGITIDGAVSVKITGNQVVGFADQDSWIRVQNASDTAIQQNVASGFITDSGRATPAGNQLVLQSSDHGYAAISVWLASHDTSTGFNGNVAKLLSFLGHSQSAPLVDASLSSAVLISGTSGADKLSADQKFMSVLDAADGDDSLIGNGLGSHLMGGAGDDNYTIKGYGDIVTENFGEGVDSVTAYIDYTLGENVENLKLAGSALSGTGNALDNRMVGNAGDNVLHGLAGDDLIQGGDGNDRIFGDGGNDVLRGDAGSDQLDGGDGNDQLLGGEGSDWLSGGSGADILEGGAGNDVLTGGAGADVFRFRQETAINHDADRITDFTRGQDKIDLRAIDANINSSVDDSFTFIGSNDFHHQAGELQARAVSGGMLVSGDVDGDGIPDFSIMLSGIHSLSVGDVIL